MLIILPPYLRLECLFFTDIPLIPRAGKTSTWQPSINSGELQDPSKSLLATGAELFMETNKQTSQDTLASKAHN